MHSVSGANSSILTPSRYIKWVTLHIKQEGEEGDRESRGRRERGGGERDGDKEREHKGAREWEREVIYICEREKIKKY